MIDKKAFSQLFAIAPADGEASEAAKLALWELAGILAAGAKGIDAEDARGICFEEMVRAVPTYKADRGGAFGFFFLVGRRSMWQAAHREGRQPLPMDVGGSGMACTRGGIGRAEPLVYGRKRDAGAGSPADVVDRRIKRIQKSLRHYDPAEPEYQQLHIGIKFLQEVRRDLAGSYLKMRTPLLRYMDQRVIALAS